MASPADPWPREADLDELANQLRLARGDSRWPPVPDRPDDPDGTGAVFLMGAGCSRSAGVPLAAKIAQDTVPILVRRYSDGKSRITDPERALKWLKARKHLTDRKGATWSDYYSEIFARHFRSDPQQRRIIQANVAKAAGQINWAHICLGELVDQHFVHTVLTTNFDRLVLDGIILAGRVPVIADGIEALTRISSRPTTPQVVHLHGSVHAYSPLNSPEAMVGAGRALPMQGTMYGVLKDTDFLVVVGYAGGEDGVMALLSEATKVLPNLGIYWVFYENSLTAVRREVRDILNGPNKYYILGQDADAFFAKLTRALKIQPSWMEAPLSPLEARLNSVVHEPNLEIELAVAGYRRALASFADSIAKPDSDEAIIERAASFSLAGRYGEVLDLITAALATKHPPAARLRAMALQGQGDTDNSSPMLLRAVNQWEAYLRAVPSDGDAYWRLGKAFASLAEKARGQSVRWAGAVQAYRKAVAALKRSQPGWVECRLDLAAAVVETGAKGGSGADITAAVAALDELLRTGDVGPDSTLGARILDLRGTLLLMRATLKGKRADFGAAIQASLEAISGVWSSLSSSEAIGAHHHLAQAYRDYAKWLLAGGRRAEALAPLLEAMQLFAAVEAAYRQGTPDAELDQLSVPAKAAHDGVLAVGELIDVLRAELNPSA